MPTACLTIYFIPGVTWVNLAGSIARDFGETLILPAIGGFRPLGLVAATSSTFLAFILVAINIQNLWCHLQ